MKIVIYLQLCTYKLKKCLLKLYSYICYLYNAITISRIHIIAFVIPTFIYTYLARNNYSEKTAFEYI